MAKKRRKMRVSKSSSSSSSCGMSAGGCKSWGWIILVLGVIYLLQDLGTLAQWGLNWPLQWWTAGLLLLGLKGVMSGR